MKQKTRPNGVSRAHQIYVFNLRNGAASVINCAAVFRRINLKVDELKNIRRTKKWFSFLRKRTLARFAHLLFNLCGTTLLSSELQMKKKKKKEKRKVCLITCDNLNEMEKRTSRVLSNLHYLDIAFTWRRLNLVMKLRKHLSSVTIFFSKYMSMNYPNDQT